MDETLAVRDTEVDSLDGFSLPLTPCRTGTVRAFFIFLVFSVFYFFVF